jgi:membrane-bound lytic murein transglycosylase B
MRLQRSRVVLAGLILTAGLVACGGSKYLSVSAMASSNDGTQQQPKVGNAVVQLSSTAPESSAAGSQEISQSGPTDPLPSQSAFSRWRDEFRSEALRAGISADIFDAALGEAVPDPKVMKANAEQPEFVKPIWAYLEGAVTPARIEKGNVLLSTHRALFDRIEAFYGVDREIIAVIWAVESNFGEFTGNFHVPTALATLAFEGRRTTYGRSQLMAALQILEMKDIAPRNMLGSWAGAMGHTQFIPTSYLAYAVDADGDGRRDIWNSIADALSSTANYLSKAGWRRGLPWGVEVTLPTEFDYAQAEDSLRKPVGLWLAQGIKSADGRAIGLKSEDMARLILPAGYRGPAFLITDNFDALLAYNNATVYGLTVGHMATRLRGGPAIIANWPREDVPLARAEREELQARLQARGFNPGPVDGIIGKATRDAVRAFQRSAGLPADGHSSKALLERLRQPN